MPINNFFALFLRLPTKTRLFLLGLLSLCFLLVLIVLGIKNKPLKITDTNPADQSQNIDLELKKITLVFNRPLKNLSEVQINSLPSLAFSPQLDNSKQILSLSFSQTLLANETYSLEIVSPKNNSSIYSFSFKTKKAEIVGRGDSNIGQKLFQKDQEDFPLLHWVPYSAPDLEIDYLSPRKLEVKTTMSPENARPLVEAWMQSHGVEPQTHEIVFPSL